MGRKRTTIEQLRLAIDCLPTDTRVAMLRGIRENEIIVGAYTDRDGGVCPMLAAHRCGGRTDFISFAKSWDRFTKATSRSRKASERELRILTSHLEASLLNEEAGSVDFARAISEHAELRSRRPAAEPAKPRRRRGPRPGEPERTRELRTKPGWAWLRPFRRLDEYERALARVEAEREAVEAERETELV
jgi:hypothetical protein